MNDEQIQESRAGAHAAGAPAELQGRVVVAAGDQAALREAIDLAFDYRGDVTIIRRSTGEAIEGYLFDRRCADALERSTVRMIASGDGSRLTIPCADIGELRFTGRDTAAGRSFETWMRKYVERKLAGLEASIEAEPLE